MILFNNSESSFQILIVVISIIIIIIIIILIFIRVPEQYGLWGESAIDDCSYGLNTDLKA